MTAQDPQPVNDPFEELRRLADPHCTRCSGDGWCETIDDDTGNVLATYDCPCVTRRARWQGTYYQGTEAMMKPPRKPITPDPTSQSDLAGQLEQTRRVAQQLVDAASVAVIALTYVTIAAPAPAPTITRGMQDAITAAAELGITPQEPNDA